jgi:hypothetical protein
MRKSEVETWASQIVDRLRAGQPLEDSRVELKREWIDAVKAARQLAGHANAARGDDILWLVGLDEKGQQVSGVDPAGLLDWWNKTKAQFDELHPAMTDLVVPVGGDVSVMALLFETDRAPFVVKVAASDRLDVPWRDGTGVRSARRSDLLRVLAPIKQRADFEVLDVELLCVRMDNRGDPTWQLTVRMYVTPPGHEPLVIPLHRCSAEIVFAGAERMTLSECFFLGGSIGASQKTLPGPGMAEFMATREITLNIRTGPAAAEVSIAPVRADRPHRFRFDLEPAPDGDSIHRWVLKR